MRFAGLHPRTDGHRWNRSGRFTSRGACVVAAIAGFGFATPAHAEGWGFAAEVGAITATAVGSPTVFRITSTKTVSPEFAFGPTFYLTPLGDDQMYSGALMAEFVAPARRVKIVPFIGIGLAHRRSENGDSTALMFPLGSSVDYPVGKTLSLRGTASFNIHNIELEGEDDNLSLGLTAGINYRP